MLNKLDTLIESVRSFLPTPIATSLRSRRSFLVIVILVGGLVVSASPVIAQGRYDAARGLINRVQQDLRHAEEMASQHKHSKDSERINNAQHHLSDFDRSLSKGKFDSGRLDHAISDVKNVIDHNTLSPEDRDNLNGDLRDMRSMRSSRGR